MSLLGLVDHPAEIAAAEEVDVEMLHFLAPVAPMIGEQAIAGRGDALVACDLAEGADERRDLGVGGPLGEIIGRDVLALANDEHMRRRLRRAVAESEDTRLLEALVARNLSAHDAGEAIIAVV